MEGRRNEIIEEEEMQAPKNERQSPSVTPMNESGPLKTVQRTAKEYPHQTPFKYNKEQLKFT